MKPLLFFLICLSGGPLTAIPAGAAGLASLAGRSPASVLSDRFGERPGEQSQAQRMLQETSKTVQNGRTPALPGSTGPEFHACGDSVGAFYDARVNSAGSMGCQAEDNGWNRTSNIAGAAISLSLGD